MPPVDRLCRLLALTIYDVRHHPSPEEEAQILRLRHALIELWVALNDGRISPQEAAPRMKALEQEILWCRARVNPKMRHPLDLK